MTAKNALDGIALRVAQLAGGLLAGSLNPAGASANPRMREAAPVRTQKLLLVDDDDVYRLQAAASLRDRGFEVAECSSGASAAEWLSHSVPDVVVLDAVMPHIDGFALCRQLRRMPSMENLPVLMVTGLNDDGSIDRAYEAGATDFFVKSTQWSLLAGRLRYLLRMARVHEELILSRAKLAKAQDLARMGSFEWRARPERLSFSREALRVLGQRTHWRATWPHTMRLIQRSDRRAFLALVRQTAGLSTVLDVDTAIQFPDGRRRIIHIEAEPDFDEAGRLSGYTGVLQDVTDRRVIEDKIKHLANFDALTGLPNRRQIMWRAERALEHSRRHGHACALLLIDLDRFKIINDTLGHAAGDELLVECARRLRSCVRHSDQVMEGTMDSVLLRSHRVLEAVGRLGGDEFVALLPEVSDEAEAEKVAERVLSAMRDPVLIGDQEYFVTASVGVAVYPRDGGTVVDLMRNADVAMYSVKAAGRNAMQLYKPHLAGQSREKLELESALHKALERGELVLHYQPKIDVHSGAVVGVEALMRWQRQGRLVPPLEFIPLAEETGLIIPISEWAIADAARQVRRWRDSNGIEVPIAINLPSRSFERSDLAERLRAAGEACAVPHRLLELEITETGLMKGLQDVMPALRQLNDIGIAISVDDFGTGYSSLAYLTSLPISEVKIDRSFVRDLGVTSQSSAVVTAIIALARSLGLRVIAEGVETDRQMHELHRLGCGLMQGFLFARPMAPDELGRWLETVQAGQDMPWNPLLNRNPSSTRRALLTLTPSH